MGKFYVYIFESDKGFHYYGQTSDLEKRLTEHNSNLTKSTKNRGNWEVIASKLCISRTDTMMLKSKLEEIKTGEG